MKIAYEVFIFKSLGMCQGDGSLDTFSVVMFLDGAPGSIHFVT